jgi:hypothetical protein
MLEIPFTQSVKKQKPRSILIYKLELKLKLLMIYKEIKIHRKAKSIMYIQMYILKTTLHHFFLKIRRLKNNILFK